MTAQLIDGKIVAAQLREEIANVVRSQRAEGKRQPGLAVILIGEDPASTIYVRNKRQACEQVGILSFYHHLPNTVEEKDLINLVTTLNQDKKDRRDG